MVAVHSCREAENSTTWVFGPARRQEGKLQFKKAKPKSFFKLVINAISPGIIC